MISDLGAGDPEDALVVQPVQVDEPDAALHHQRDVLLRQLQVFLQAAPEELGLARQHRPPDAPPGVGNRTRQRGGGATAARALLTQALPDVVVLGLEASDAVAVEDVLAELGQVELFRLLPVNALFV